MGCTQSGGAAYTPSKVHVLEKSDHAQSNSPYARQPDFSSRFQLLDEIGSGGFARVHSVKPLGQSQVQPLVVKVVDLQPPSADDKKVGTQAKDKAYQMYKYRRKMAMQEAWILEMLVNQKHCCKWVSTHADRSTVYILMEKCERPLLTHLSYMPELSERTIAKVARQMFQAAAGIHKVGIMHRDIKPDNFMCQGPTNKIVLIDFGFACFTGWEKARGARGTAPFMSPEMLTGDGSHGMETDIWSLGSIMHVLLFGEFPYMPEQGSSAAMKEAIAIGEPKPLFLLPGSASSLEAKALLKRLLDRSPSSRLNAGTALDHKWMAEEISSNNASCCLRPMLDAAVAIGAFSHVHHGQPDQPALQADAKVDSPVSSLSLGVEEPAGQMADGETLLQRRQRWLPTVNSTMSMASSCSASSSAGEWIDRGRSMDKPCSPMSATSTSVPSDGCCPQPDTPSAAASRSDAVA